MSPGRELCHTNKVSIAVIQQALGDGDYNLGKEFIQHQRLPCVRKGVVLSIDITFVRTHLVHRWALFCSHGLLLYDPGSTILITSR